jgi:hypothetical protein
MNKVLGFETLLLISKSGRDLYLLIRASRGDLRTHAQDQGYLLALDVGYTDLDSQPPFSLEPCDLNLNPLNRIIVPEEYKEKVDQLENSVTISLAKIYKVSKENTTNAQAFNISDEELANELGTDDIFTSKGVTNETWESYIMFLEVLSKTLYNCVNDNTINLRGYRVGIFIGLAYRAALMYTNQHAKSNKGLLYHLWNRLGLKYPIPATTPYVRQINDLGVDEFDKFWVRHVIDESNRRSIFSNTDKIKIMDTAIQNSFKIYNLLHYKYIKGYFPLHNEYELKGWKRVKNPPPDKVEEDLIKVMGEEVYDTVAREPKFVIPEWKMTPFKVFSPPLKIIRDYFGEKIAYYFDFLAYYTKFMYILVPLGIILAITFWSSKEDFIFLRIMYGIYGITNVLVSTLFIEYLKRREKFLASEWGTTNIVEEEFIRPLFKGIFRRSPIDDDLNDPHNTFCNKYWRLMLSWTAMFICAALSCGVSVLLFWARWALAKEWEGSDKIVAAAFITAIIKAASISILDVIFKPIAFYLTRFENRKSRETFERSYVLKLFVFRFINNYGSLYYIAFAKRHVDGCITAATDQLTNDNECMWELRYELIFIFAFYLLQNVYEFFIPFCRMGKAANKKLNDKTIKGKSQESILKMKVYIEWHKSSYDDGEINGVIEEYMEIVIQAGYVFLFSIAFALIPLI